ncbi:MAG: aldose 1-epimerase [Candidatus Nanopelagicales bacterium]
MTYDVRTGPDPEDPRLDRVTLVSPDGVEAAFLPGHGMLGTSLRLGGAELLARRGGLPAHPEKGWSFGIPLLAPWANRLRTHGQQVGDAAWTVGPGAIPDDNGHPIHGLVALLPFEVARAEAVDGAAVLHGLLEFGPALPSFPSFPFPHHLDVEAALSGRVLRIATTLTPTADVAVPVAFGWHPWFELPGAPRPDWVVEAPFTDQAVLDAENLPTGEVLEEAFPSGRLADRFMDDVWLGVPADARASVSGGGHRVTVRYAEGYDVAVVFAPLLFDAVCFEPMTARTDPFEGWDRLHVVQPGSSYTAVFEIEVASEAADGGA